MHPSTIQAEEALQAMLPTLVCNNLGVLGSKRPGHHALFNAGVTEPVFLLSRSSLGRRKFLGLGWSSKTNRMIEAWKEKKNACELLTL